MLQWQKWGQPRFALPGIPGGQKAKNRYRGKAISSDNVSESQNEGRGRGTGAAYIHQQLREAILSLEIEPGLRLDEKSLSERYGLSRSPVREALIKLASEGLVVLLPNRGAQVSPIEVSNFPRYLDALDLMQRVSNRLAAQLRSSADMAQIQDRRDSFEAVAVSGDGMGMIEAKRDFHVSIAKAAKNPYFESLNTRLLDEGMRMQRVHHLNSVGNGPYEQKHLTRILADHNELTEAIADQDADRAEALAHEHVEQFRWRFVEYIRQNPSFAVDLSKWPKEARGRELKKA